MSRIDNKMTRTISIRLASDFEPSSLVIVSFLIYLKRRTLSLFALCPHMNFTFSHCAYSHFLTLPFPPALFYSLPSTLQAVGSTSTFGDWSVERGVALTFNAKEGVWRAEVKLDDCEKGL